MNSVPSTSSNNGIEELYRKNQRKSVAFLVVLAVLLILAILFSLRAGSYNTPIGELLRGIFGRASDRKINLVVQGHRLPRIITAILTGSGLGLSGCILQALLRNPLASSSTLGVSQGATFGAAFAIVGLGFTQGGSFSIPFFAFLGSLSVALVILGLSKFRSITPEGIILAGVAISSMLTGATTLMQYFADEVQLSTLVFWTFGDLGSTGWEDLGEMAIVVVFLSLYCIYHRWDYNALLSGEETAISLGINVKRLTLVGMLFASLCSAVVVSKVGLISFIGLVAPHLVRMVVGNNHVYLIPGSILCGATLLLLGDLFARTIISPVILPIGAITSFLGGPLFLYLLFKGGKK
ncbi:FecCD family ABC transporter permease [Guggenheimella bovis]